MGRIAATLALAALLIAACAGDAEETALGATPGATGSTAVGAPSGPTSATAATPPTGSAGEPTGSLEPELEDGEHLGFVDSVDVDGGTMVFDLAYFLTGEEANQAAAERGLEVPVPNDYFIVNDDPRLRTPALAPDLELALVDWDRCRDAFVEGDLATFAAAVGSGDVTTVGGQTYHGSLSRTGSRSRPAW